MPKGMAVSGAVATAASPAVTVVVGLGELISGTLKTMLFGFPVLATVRLGASIGKALMRAFAEGLKSAGVGNGPMPLKTCSLS